MSSSVNLSTLALLNPLSEFNLL